MSWWVPREDARPGAVPAIVEEHRGTPQEIVRWTCRVRLPWGPKPRLVIRAYTATAAVTVALEPSE